MIMLNLFMSFNLELKFIHLSNSESKSRTFYHDPEPLFIFTE
jgi:hypothetical protein